MNKGSAGSFSSLSLVAKTGILLVVFGFLPVFIALTAMNYKNQAEFILEGSGAASRSIIEDVGENERGGASVLTREQAETIREVRLFLVGRWISLQDRNYSVEILPNNTFKDKDGDIVVAYGTWSNHVSSTSSGSTKFDANQKLSADSVSNKKDSYYLTKIHLEQQHKDEKFSYEIMQLDKDRAILYYTGNGKVLYFVREGSEADTATSSAVSATRR